MYIPVSSKLHIPQHHAVSSTFPLRRNTTISIKRSTTPTVPRTVRKNSGEVVRPCLRQRSHTLGGPQKFVHFGQDLEYVRWFLKAQSPQAVQQDAQAPSPTPSPIPSEASSMKLTAIRPPAPSPFAAYECWRPVVLEHVEMTKGWMAGTVKVHNLAFEKSVSVRYSLDSWKHVEETEAQFSSTLQLPIPQAEVLGVDRFQFKFQLPTAMPALISICVRYDVCGSQYWDNNQGSNYLFKLARPAAPVIEDEDVATRASQTFERLPTSSPLASVSMADTRRYMEQSTMMFGGDAPVSQGPPLSPYMHYRPSLSRQLPLFQDSAWCGSDDFVSTFSTQMDIQKYQVFDADGSLLSRTGSPLAWSSNTQTSALQC